MTLVLSTADGGGAVKSGTMEIVAVDRDAGTVTVDDDIDNLVATAAQNDYIFVQGDYDAKVKGLLAWIPSSAPASNDNFFSVNRSHDATRLAGIRVDGSNLPIEEALVKAASRVGREGHSPDVVFMSFAKYTDLVNALGSKVQFINEQVKAGQGFVGFQGVMIHGPRGAIKVIPDQNCPSDRAFMLTMKYWKLYSLNKAPRILDTDGLKMLRESSADAVEVRVGYYAQLGCRAPGANANISL
jgi:hypothetical protein